MALIIPNSNSITTTDVNVSNGQLSMMARITLPNGGPSPVGIWSFSGLNGLRPNTYLFVNNSVSAVTITLPQTGTSIGEALFGHEMNINNDATSISNIIIRSFTNALIKTITPGNTFSLRVTDTSTNNWSSFLSGSNNPSITTITGTSPISAITSGNTTTVSLNNSGVSPNTYVLSNIVVNNKGIITSASSGSILDATSGYYSIINNPGSNTPIFMKQLQSGFNTTIVDNGSYLLIDSTGGGTTPAVYLNGSGFGNPTGINYTGAVSISNSGYGIDINILSGNIQNVYNAAGGSYSTLVQNAGSGPDINIKELQAGSGITIVDNGTYLTLIGTGGGGYATIYQNGSSFGNPSGLNFTGAVSISSSGFGVDITIGAGYISTIQDATSGYYSIINNPGSGPTINMKQIQAGSNMSITDNGTYLTLDSSGGGGYPTIYQNGSSYGTQSGLNFTGNVSISSSGYGVDISIGSGSLTVYNNGSSYGNQTGINFTGGCAVSSSGYGVDVFVTPGPQGDPGPTGPQGNPGVIQSVDNATSGYVSLINNPGSNTTIYMKQIQAGSNITINDFGSYFSIDSSGGGSYPTIYQNGSSYGSQSGLNFTGSVSISSSVYGVDINIGSGSGYPTIYNNGGSYGAQSGLNFTGNITVSNSGYGVDITSNYATIYGNTSSYGAQPGLNFSSNFTVNYSVYGVDIDINPSSRRYKTNIITFDESEYNKIDMFRLDPVEFIYKNDKTEKKQIGLIAEEVDEIGYKCLVNYKKNLDENGNKLDENYGEECPDSVNYDKITILLLEKVKKQQNQINELKDEINELKTLIYSLVK